MPIADWAKAIQDQAWEINQWSWTLSHSAHDGHFQGCKEALDRLMGAIDVAIVTLEDTGQAGDNWPVSDIVFETLSQDPCSDCGRFEVEGCLAACPSQTWF